MNSRFLVGRGWHRVQHGHLPDVDTGKLGQMYVCDCGRTPPDDYSFCGCGQPIVQAPTPGTSPRSTRLGNNVGGVQAGRDITARQIIVGKDPSDPYEYRTHIARKSQKRSVLPDNWVAAVAGICTIASFLLMAFPPDSVPSGLALLYPTLAGIGFILFAGFGYLRLVLQPGQVLVRPFGSERPIYEKASDGTVFSTYLEADCIWCASNGLNSKMAIRHVNNEIVWVCRTNPSQHRIGFDPTSVGP